jgi:hypothetical protein
MTATLSKDNVRYSHHEVDGVLLAMDSWQERSLRIRASRVTRCCACQVHQMVGLDVDTVYASRGAIPLAFASAQTKRCFSLGFHRSRALYVYEHESERKIMNKYIRGPRCCVDMRVAPLFFGTCNTLVTRNAALLCHAIAERNKENHGITEQIYVLFSPSLVRKSKSSSTHHQVSLPRAALRRNGAPHRCHGG